MTDTTSVKTYTYDNANRLTKVNGATYTWDERGNLISDGENTYAYDSAGWMRRVVTANGVLEYTYNADGLRVRQGADTFTWDWATSVPELLRGDDSVYLVGHDTLGWQTGTNWTYVLPDALGSVRQEADADGNGIEVREWSPYGEELGEAQDGLGYTGEWFDAGLGLTYLRARWYDSETGRFTSQDPWEGNHNRPQSLNNWVYVEGNPENTTDESGLCTLCARGSTVSIWNTGWEGIDAREFPSPDARSLIRLYDNNTVVIAKDVPILDSGREWYITYIKKGLEYIEGWLPSQYLRDQTESPKAHSSDGPFQISTPPVTLKNVSYVQGFGATQFAYQSCGTACNLDEGTSSCPYRSTRGVHNGLDFVVPSGTVVYWPDNLGGIVVDKFAADASPNVVVKVTMNDYVLFGHLDGGILVEKNQYLWPGTPIGSTGASGHLHMGIRSETKFHNPLYFFETNLADQIVSLMGEYTEGEGPWSMKAYTYSSGRCKRYFWQCNTGEWDQTGIDR